VDQDRGQWQDFLNTAKNLLYKSKEFLGSLATISFSTNVTQWRYRRSSFWPLFTFASVNKLSRYSPCRRQEGEEYFPYSILTSALDGVSGQHHAPATLYPRERTAGTHWIGSWVGPTAGLDSDARGSILCFCRGSNPSSIRLCHLGESMCVRNLI
jgi:hypothetical protein